MVIDVLTVGGSPKDISAETVFSRGVGGAELALVTWAEAMASRGHEVKIWNQTKGQEFFLNGVHYKLDAYFQPNNERDILVTFRGPQEQALSAKYKKHIGWSCDQYTLGDYIGWYNSVNELVVISDFHKQDHLRRYGSVAEKARVIDLGVRTWEYEDIYQISKMGLSETIKKNPNQFIYCSVPDRGLDGLARIWPRIKERYPEANLIITSDYTLWGAGEPLNVPYKLKFVGLQGVRFVGNVNRNELVRYQLESAIQIYPCIYDENFCIANAECQVAGVFGITTNQGALETTNFTGMKYPTVAFEGEFMKAIDWYYSMEDKDKVHSYIKQKALERFSWDKIAVEWERLFN
jgi:glycosyltransferase involved in cell wall biosynthesis